MYSQINLESIELNEAISVQDHIVSHQKTSVLKLAKQWVCHEGHMLTTGTKSQ